MEEQDSWSSSKVSKGDSRKPIKQVDWDYRTKISPASYTSTKPTRPAIVFQPRPKVHPSIRILKSLNPDTEVDNFFKKKSDLPTSETENRKFENEREKGRIKMSKKSQNSIVNDANNSTRNNVSTRPARYGIVRNYPKPWLLNTEIRDSPGTERNMLRRESRKIMDEIKKNYTEHVPPWRRASQTKKVVMIDESTEVSDPKFIQTKLKDETEPLKRERPKIKIKYPKFRKKKPLTPGGNHHNQTHIRRERARPWPLPWEAEYQPMKSEDDKSKDKSLGSRSVARKLDEALGNTSGKEPTRGLSMFYGHYGQRHRVLPSTSTRTTKNWALEAPGISQIQFYTFEEAVNGVRKNLADIINYNLQSDDLDTIDPRELQQGQIGDSMTAFVPDMTKEMVTRSQRTEFDSPDSQKADSEQVRINHLNQAYNKSNIEAVDMKQMQLDRSVNKNLFVSKPFKPQNSEFFSRQDEDSGFPELFRPSLLTENPEDEQNEFDEGEENVIRKSIVDIQDEDIYRHSAPRDWHVDQFESQQSAYSTEPNDSEYRKPMSNIAGFRSTPPLDYANQPFFSDRMKTEDYYLKSSTKKSSTLPPLEYGRYILPPQDSDYKNKILQPQHNVVKSQRSPSAMLLEFYHITNEALSHQLKSREHFTQSNSFNPASSTDEFILPSPPPTPNTNFGYNSYRNDNTFGQKLVTRQRSPSMDYFLKQTLHDGTRKENCLHQCCLKKPGLRCLGLDDDSRPHTPTSLSADSSTTSLRVLVSRGRYQIKSIPSCNCENCRKCREYLLGARKSQSLSSLDLDQTNYVWKNIIETKNFKKPAPKNQKQLIVDHPKGDRVPPMVLYAGRKGYGQVPEYLKKRKVKVLAEKQARLEENLQRTLTDIYAVEDRRRRSRRFYTKQLILEAMEKALQMQEDQSNKTIKMKCESFTQSSWIRIPEQKEYRKYDDIFIGSYHPTPTNDDQEEELQHYRSEEFANKSAEKENKETALKVSSAEPPVSALKTEENIEIKREIISTLGKNKPVASPHSSDSEPSIDISVADVRITPSLPAKVQH